MCRGLQDDEDDGHDYFNMRRLSIYRSRLFDMGLQAVSEHARSLRQGMHGASGTHQRDIERNLVFQTQHSKTTHVTSSKICNHPPQGFQIQFLSDDDVAEDGVDGGGLFKEFLTMLLRELMNMDRCCCCSCGSSVFRSLCCRGYFTETSAHQLWPHPQAIQFHGSDIFRNIGRVRLHTFS